MDHKKDTGNLKSCVSPLGAWALAFGCSIGWGAFVMPGSTFLPIAGPLGTLIGLTVGGVLMLVFAWNYHYMMQHCSGAGGAYSYAMKLFGRDHAFLAGWFLILAYIVVFWGNATALPMIARYLLGDLFQTGWIYTIFGYDVYFGEIALSIGFMLLASLLCLKPSWSMKGQNLFAVLLASGIALCVFAVVVKPGSVRLNFTPVFAPKISPVSGIFSIVSLTPWAFVGFETISNSAEEFLFDKKKAFWIMVIALICAAAAYGLLSLLSIAWLPSESGGWPEYLNGVDSAQGITALPVFSSVRQIIGEGGVILLAAASFSAICTGLIGYITAASRMLYAAGKEGMLPEAFCRVNKSGAPDRAVLFILLSSLLVPFLGRTAINWLVDVTTVCILIAYAYVSAAVIRTAGENGHTGAMICGIIGAGISAVFAVLFLVPNLLLIRTLSAESYLLIAVWSILGLLVFRYNYSHGADQGSRPAAMVWAVFLTLIIYTSLIWVLQTAAMVEERTSQNIEQHFLQSSEINREDTAEDRVYVQKELKESNQIMRNSSMVQIGLIIAAMMIIFSINDTMQKRTKQLEIEKIRAEENSRSKSTFLSNMSHDIRTPMNAIVGMTALAKDHIDDREFLQECLSKISSSSRQLLGLINDVLDMSKIESGKMTLNPEALSLCDSMETICDIVLPQIRARNQIFDVYVRDMIWEEVYCDSVRLNQVLLNFLSNAMKFTPEGGSVRFDLWQCLSSKGDDHVEVHFEVKDTGSGMSKEFQEKLFTAFEREDSLRVHKTQGTGLGLSIAKFIVDAMGGTIGVESEPGKGTVFHVTIDFERVMDKEAEMNLDGWKVLIVDENEELGRNAAAIIESLGAHAETAQTKADALMLAEEAYRNGNGFNAAVTAYTMTGTDGVEVSKALKKTAGNENIECLISAYDRTELKDAGEFRFIAKPFFKSTLYHALDTLKAQTAQDMGEMSSTETVLAGRTFLLAEDNDINAEIATMMLEDIGAAVERAEDGKKAAELFEQSEEGHYDAVLMDLRMPNMNGIEATKYIRSLNRQDAAKIPILALTADAFAEDAQKCIEAGMNAHLSKPIDIELLKKTLLNYLL